MKQYLIIMHGFSGTGKSAIAKKLAENTGYKIFQSDMIRKKLAGKKKTERNNNDYDRGIYSPKFTNITYDVMLKLAEKNLKRGNSVILDATFNKVKHREKARKISTDYAADCIIIQCSLDEKLIKERLKKRENEDNDVSDANWQIYLNQKNNFEPLSYLEKEMTLTVDTHNEITENTNKIIKYLGYPVN